MWSGMTGKEVLQLQLNGPFNVLHEQLVTVSAQEWIAREILGAWAGSPSGTPPAGIAA